MTTPNGHTAQLPTARYVAGRRNGRKGTAGKRATAPAVVGSDTTAIQEDLVTEPIQVDVWSDVACPWCYIGKRRFAEGVRRYRAAGGSSDVTVTYHSFELAPDVPDDYDGTAAEFLSAHKGIPADQVRQMMQQVTELAAAEGLDYNFDAVRTVRTRKAHELLHLAKEHGAQEALKERLLAAHFTEGVSLADDEELVRLSVEVGLDADLVREALATRQFAPAVDADIALAGSYGISGVPFHVVAGRYGVSGAQDPDTFAELLLTIDAESAAAADA